MFPSSSQLQCTFASPLVECNVSFGAHCGEHLDSNVPFCSVACRKMSFYSATANPEVGLSHFKGYSVVNAWFTGFLFYYSHNFMKSGGKVQFCVTFAFMPWQMHPSRPTQRRSET